MAFGFVSDAISSVGNAIWGDEEEVAQAEQQAQNYKQQVDMLESELEQREKQMEDLAEKVEETQGIDTIYLIGGGVVIAGMFLYFN